jgi:hypothetical protein
MPYALVALRSKGWPEMGAMPVVMATTVLSRVWHLMHLTFMISYDDFMGAGNAAGSNRMLSPFPTTFRPACAAVLRRQRKRIMSKDFRIDFLLAHRIFPGLIIRN